MLDVLYMLSSSSLSDYSLTDPRSWAFPEISVSSQTISETAPQPLPSAPYDFPTPVSPCRSVDPSAPPLTDGSKPEPWEWPLICLFSSFPQPIIHQYVLTVLHLNYFLKPPASPHLWFLIAIASFLSSQLPLSTQRDTMITLEHKLSHAALTPETLPRLTTALTTESRPTCRALPGPVPATSPSSSRPRSLYPLLSSRPIGSFCDLKHAKLNNISRPFPQLFLFFWHFSPSKLSITGFFSLASSQS